MNVSIHDPCMRHIIELRDLFERKCSALLMELECLIRAAHSGEALPVNLIAWLVKFNGK